MLILFIQTQTGAQAYADCVNAEIERIEKKVSETHVQDGKITDSWEDIIASCNDGSYKEKYHIGDTKALDLESEGVVDMQIAAFDADELADGTGTAAITWISRQLLKSDHRMNPDLETDPLVSPNNKIGTGSCGGWKNSEMRAWLKSEVKPLIPPIVRNAIKPVKKYSSSYGLTQYHWIDNEITKDDVWIPSYREIGDINYSGYETNGPSYTDLFVSSSERVKQKIGESDASWWWLRTAYYGTSHGFIAVLPDGSTNYLIYSIYEDGVALGFCT